MDNDKGISFDDETTHESDLNVDTAPRARNRTVMLTPEITGQVRARLQQDGPQAPIEAPTSAQDPGFQPVTSRRSGAESSFNPPASASTREAAPVVQTAARPPARDSIVWSRPSGVIGFLVSFDDDEHGEVFILRSGRLIVTSEVPVGGSYLFIKHASVSPMHAIVRISEEGEVQVLDQLSEFGTGVKRYESGEELQLSGDKCVLNHGDTLRFGKRTFWLCLMPMRSE